MAPPPLPHPPYSYSNMPLQMGRELGWRRHGFCHARRRYCVSSWRGSGIGRHVARHFGPGSGDVGSWGATARPRPWAYLKFLVLFFLVCAKIKQHVLHWLSSRAYWLTPLVTPSTLKLAFKLTFKLTLKLALSTKLSSWHIRLVSRHGFSRSTGATF